MFHFPNDILTYKHYLVLTEKPLNSRKIKNLESEGYLNCLIETPQHWSLLPKKATNSFFSRSPGYVLPNLIKQGIQREHGGVTGFVYIEVLADTLQLTIYSKEGLLQFDQFFTINNSSEAHATLLEIELELKGSSFGTLPIYLADGNQKLESFVNNWKSDIPLPARLKGALYPVSKRKLKLSGAVISFDNATLDLTAIVDLNEKNLNTHDADPQLTQLTIQELVGLSATINVKSHTKNTSQYRSGALQSKVVYTLGLTAIFGLYQFYDYTLQQKRIAEQKALKSSQVRIESPWRAYREDITNKSKNFQAESGLQRVYGMLKSFQDADKSFKGYSLGWAIAEFSMSNNLMTLYPTTTGGTNQRLNEFSNRMKLRQSSGKRGTQVDALFQENAINSSVYLTSVTGETNYLEDAMTWLFDDITISTTNTLVNGNGKGQYRVHLVQIEFKCWLPEDFLYASTQMAFRNYAIHSVEAKNVEYKVNEEMENPDSDSAFKEAETDSECDFGYQGSIYLKLFGSN